MAQAVIHGANIIEIDGSFDDALKIVCQSKFEIVNSINPFRIEGQKTAAFEICDELGDAPDFHFIPVGNGGNITAYWIGYNEYFKCGKCTKLPKMIGWQAEGAAPIVKNNKIINPKTIASAINIGNPINWEKVTTVLTQSKGNIHMVSDIEILKAQKMLANLEGIYVEPASATGIAGILKYHEQNKIKDTDTIVITLTGHGLKDS